MTWFKIDDSFADHPKVKRIPRRDRVAAVGLWTLAGAWSARHLTDGQIPAYMVEELGGTDRQADALVAVGLWLRTGDAFDFHGWSEWQPSRNDIEARRRSDAERKAKWRQSKHEKRSGHGGTETGQRDMSRVDTPGTDASVRSTRPDPTRPDPKERTSVPRKRGTRIDPTYRPSPELIAWARTEAPGIDVRAVTEQFVDYWTAATGQKATKLDWDATWRTWVRNDKKFNGANRERQAPSHIWEAS